MKGFSTIAIALICFLFSVYMLRLGWLIIRYGRTILPFQAQVTIWLLRVFAGPDIAKQREAKMKEPKENQLHGILELVGGTVMLVVAFGFLLDGLRSIGSFP